MSSTAETEALTQGTTSDTPIADPILRLTKCVIRRYHPSDAEALVHVANSPDVAKYMTNVFPHPYNLNDAHEWFGICAAENPPMNYAICDIDSNTVLGGIGLKPAKDVYERSVEIGYWLGKDSWGKGVMSDAVRGFTLWAFEEFGHLQRVWAGIFEGNPASEKVLKRAGYTYEGTMRKMVWKEALGPRDMIVWAMIREDLQNLEKKIG